MLSPTGTHGETKESVPNSSALRMRKRQAEDSLEFAESDKGEINEKL